MIAELWRRTRNPVRGLAIACPILVTATLAATAAPSFVTQSPQIVGDRSRDPHRPPCTTAACKKIKAFLKREYCGEPDFGNGPSDGCGMDGKGRASHVRALAAFVCRWNDRKLRSECQQTGQPSDTVRTVLNRELRRLGLPANDGRDTHFVVWKSASADWTLAAAYYEHLNGENVALCQVIATLGPASRVKVVRQVPFQETDSDVPLVIQWSPIDIADANGDGRPELVLEGSAYEDRWVEVVEFGQDGTLKTVFSGLGYWL